MFQTKVVERKHINSMKFSRKSCRL